MRHVWKLVCENWERAVFASFGAYVLFRAIKCIEASNLPDAAILFGIAFVSFAYANLSRFKRFKGFGFEAELWEDKQKEAAGLIEKLRSVVSIYTKETILSNVKAGRIGGGDEWSKRWNLFDDLIAQHQVLGQKIDFSELKREVDDYFLFDMLLICGNAVREAINVACNRASRNIDAKFGGKNMDREAFNAGHAALNKIVRSVEDPFDVCCRTNLAAEILALLDRATQKLQQEFGITVEAAEWVVPRLNAISQVYQNRPIVVTPELIEWATHESQRRKR